MKSGKNITEQEMLAMFEKRKNEYLSIDIALSKTKLAKIIHTMKIELQLDINIGILCKIAGISRTCYYDYVNSLPNAKTKAERDELDFKLILDAYNFGGTSKGARSIKEVLAEHYGVVMNLKKIRRLMKKYNLSYAPSKILIQEEFNKLNFLLNPNMKEVIKIEYDEDLINELRKLYKSIKSN